MNFQGQRTSRKLKRLWTPATLISRWNYDC